MGKKRFGVSIREEVADILDSLADYLSLSRSTVVEKAVENYVSVYLHYYRKEHECKSILIIVSRGRGEKTSYNKVLEVYRDIVKNTTHYHVDDKCIVVMYMEGQSNMIMSAYRDVLDEKTYLATILVPLCGNFLSNTR